MSRFGPRPVNERLRRLLVMLPWLMDKGSVSTSEMAEHFGLSESDLVTDLTLVSLCGVSQDPRDLIDVWVDEDQVHFGLPKYFERPLRLTVPEAFSLIAAAMAAGQLTGDRNRGPLVSALRKVADAVGVDPERDLALEMEAPATLAPAVDACSSRRVVEFDYWSVSIGTSERRRAAPVEVFGDNGHWYLRAVDVATQQERTFRLDRVENMVVTDDRHEIDLGPRAQWFATLDGARRVRLRIDADVAWILEKYPSVEIETTDGRTEATLIATGERWLSRLLLRLGPHAAVIEPDEWRDLGSRTATQVLGRYR